MIYKFNANKTQVVLERVSFINYSNGVLYMTIDGFVQSVTLSHGCFVLFEREWKKAHS